MAMMLICSLLMFRVGAFSQQKHKSTARWHSDISGTEQMETGRNTRDTTGDNVILSTKNRSASMADDKNLYTFFGDGTWTGGFVAVNVVSTLFMATNLLPLQMLLGKKRSRDGVKNFCEGHYYNWGMFLGVRDGDRCD